MSRAYDVRPNLESYDALTVRGIANFAALVIVLFGLDFLARRYGFSRWLYAVIQLGWAALGLKLVWRGYKAFASREYVAPEDMTPRYAQREIRFISPRSDAAIAILVGALLILGAVVRIIQLIQGA